MSRSQPKSLQKIIIIGAQGVGKTSLMERFVAAKFSSQYKATIGADFSTKDVTIGDELITLQIWDTAGQERYQSLGTAFYRGADACVLVYDVSEAASFQKLETWRNTFIQAADIKDARDFPFVVLGNKCDLESSKHVVLPSQVSSWTSTKGDIPSFQVSKDKGLFGGTTALKQFELAFSWPRPLPFAHERSLARPPPSHRLTPFYPPSFTLLPLFLAR